MLERLPLSHPCIAGLRARSYGTVTRPKPQQKDSCQSESCPENIEDEIVDIHSAVAPQHAGHVLKELDAE